MSTKRTRVLVLICSTRPGALGPAVGKWLTETLAPTALTLDAALVPLALGDLRLPFLDEEEHPSTGVYRHEHTRRWSAIVDEADGFVVVTPEYNYGMPATLKNALDYLGPEWAWKPVGFVSYGNTSALHPGGPARQTGDDYSSPRPPGLDRRDPDHGRYARRPLPASSVPK